MSEPNHPQHTPSSPSRWVRRFASLISPLGPVLDLAAGHGRHVRLLRSLGLQVTAVDRDVAGLVAFADDPGVEILPIDLERGTAWPLEDRRFAGIVVTNYLHRPLFPAIATALSPQGVLIYETFALGNERYGRPSNPDFLLRSGELFDAFGSVLEVVAYEHGKIAGPNPRIVQRICAIRPAQGAPPARVG